MKKIIKNLVLFLTGFCVFITIEVAFRGYSFLWSGVLGGLSILILDRINDEISWDLDLVWQGLIGSAIVTMM